ncbi:unnamed protein product [Closterium sp. NIES-54]
MAAAGGAGSAAPAVAGAGEAMDVAEAPPAEAVTGGLGMDVACFSGVAAAAELEHPTTDAAAVATHAAAGMRCSDDSAFAAAPTSAAADAAAVSIPTFHFHPLANPTQKTSGTKAERAGEANTEGRNGSSSEKGSRKTGREGEEEAAKGRVRVWVRVDVKDTGMGLSANAMTRLFSPFWQVDDSSCRKHGGTGLGLSICRSLAALMGGCISVASSPRHGSTFSLHLPFTPSSAPRLAGDFQQQREEGVRSGLERLEICNQGVASSLAREMHGVMVGGAERRGGRGLGFAVERRGEGVEETKERFAGREVTNLQVQQQPQHQQVLPEGTVAAGGLADEERLEHDSSDGQRKRKRGSCGNEGEVEALEEEEEEEEEKEGEEAEGEESEEEEERSMREVEQREMDDSKRTAERQHKEEGLHLEKRLLAAPKRAGMSRTRPFFPKYNSSKTAGSGTGGISGSRGGSRSSSSGDGSGSGSRSGAAGAAAAAGGSREGGPFAGLRCLVVEDNAVNRMVVVQLLRNLRVSCDVAENGHKAVEACRSTNYHVIFMDCHMPVMDGFEATTRIRKLQSSAHIAPIAPIPGSNAVEPVPSQPTQENHHLTEAHNSRSRLHAEQGEGQRKEQPEEQRSDQREEDERADQGRVPQQHSNVSEEEERRAGHNNVVQRSTIYAVTASTMKHERDKCAHAGMDGFLAKPIRLRDLEQVLSQIVAKDRL